MNNELYKPTLPVEPGWYRCERVESDDVDCCLLTHWGLWSVPGCGNPLKPEDMSERYLFGPRVEMPVAAPVERFAVVVDDKCGGTFIDAEFAKFVANRMNVARVVRGVFVPTEIVTQ